MKISVFGAGYVGLVQAAVLANVGHDVLCVDIDAAKVESLKQGVMPIYEPGLEGWSTAMLPKAVCVSPRRWLRRVDHADIHFIAVGTPPDSEGMADLRYVYEVAETIGQKMSSNKVVISKSTVPVGTADEIKRRITAALRSRRCEDLVIDVVANPEFLKQGAAVADCQRPDRIIVGADSARGVQVLQELYAPFNRNREKSS